MLMPAMLRAMTEKRAETIGYLLDESRQRQIADDFFQPLGFCADIILVGSPCRIQFLDGKLKALDCGQHVLAQGAGQGTCGNFNGGLNFFF